MNEKMEHIDKILKNIATKSDIAVIMIKLEEIFELFKKRNQEIVVLNCNMQKLNIRVKVLEENILKK